MCAGWKFEVMPSSSTVLRDKGLLRPKRPQLRTLKRRSEIEAAATELFAERGFHAVSMRDIATASGVPLGTLTYVFPEKQPLYDQIVLRAIESFAGRAVEAVSQEGPATARFSCLVRTLVQIHAERTTYGQIIGREMIDGAQSRLAVLGRDTFRRLRQVLNPIFIEIAGPMEAETADRLTGWLTSMIHAAARSGDLQYGIFGYERPSVDALSAELEALLLNGLARLRTRAR